MAKPARGRRRLAIGSSYGPSTWNGGLSSGHWGVLDARIAGTVLGRSDGARPFATVCGAGVEPWISCMLAHGRGRWRPPVLRMAFKRSRVRLPSAPLCHARPGLKTAVLRAAITAPDLA